MIDIQNETIPEIGKSEIRHAHADTRNQTIQETRDRKNSSTMAINKYNQEMQADNNLGNISGNIQITTVGKG